MIRFALAVLLSAGSVVAAPAVMAGAAPASVAPAAATAVRSVVAAAPVAAAPVAAQAAGVLSAAQVVAAASTGQTPAQAVAAAAAHASATGTTAFISVRDRSSGAVLAQTGNADAQVGSESIFKLFLAAYYLHIYGGYANAPSSVTDELSFMIRYSDDATANSLYTDNAIPTMVADYGLSETSNSTDRSGHWGASRITAHDMAQFLYDAQRDPEVGPWLFPVMAQVNATGSDGFDQHYGFNALSGTHGSKQGWGCDSYFTSQSCAIHSVGYTDKYVAAVLQLSDSYPDPMRSNATYAAGLIQASSTQPVVVTQPAPPAPVRLVDGLYIRDPRTGAVYRIAGGAPVYVSSWAAVGGVKPYVNVTAAQFASLRTYPRDGTFLRTYPNVYRVAGGAPIYVSQWAAVGGVQAVVDVDPNAINRAGSGGFYNHLSFRPADGTFITTNPYVYRIAGGAPIYVSSWASVGGQQPATLVDVAAVNESGAGGVYSHLAFRPADGTFLQTYPYVYRVVGGAPLYVSRWAVFGGIQPVVNVDPNAINNAGGGVYSHLSFRPADGTYIQAAGQTFRIAGGAPLYVASWAAMGGQQPQTVVDPNAVTQAGGGGVYTHLRYQPADGTALQGLPGGKRYVVRGGIARAGSGANPVAITQTTIDKAGTGAQWNHLGAP